MTPQPTEIERVLMALDAGAACDRTNKADAAMADAARLLREMAADFDLHATEHDEFCKQQRRTAPRVCSCGLNTARARWRLTAAERKDES